MRLLHIVSVRLSPEVCSTKNACAVWCHLWPVWLYHIFPHYLVNVTIFWKKVIQHKMCVLIFSTTLSETFLILKKNEWDVMVNMHRSSYSCQILMKFEFSWQILEKCLNVRLVGNELFHGTIMRVMPVVCVTKWEGI